MTARALRLAGAIALLALLVTPAWPSATGNRALAHAEVVASTPGPGGIVAESPDEIRLVFSEPLEALVSSIDILNLNGQPILTRAGEVDPDDPYALVLAHPRLEDGVYRLTWRSLSAADGHGAEGFFFFGVGDVPGTLAGGPHGLVHEEPGPTDILSRWLTYVGLLLALGVAIFHQVVVRAGPMPLVLAQLLGVTLLISGAATLLIAAASGAEVGSIGDYLLGSRNGLLQLARGVVAGAGGAALLVVAPRLAGAVAATTGLVGIVLLVAAGHASALPGIAPLIGRVVHVAGAAVWIGGIVGLLGLVLRPALMTGASPPLLRSLVPRFSALALTSIGLVALTGVYSAYVQTGALLNVETQYGRTLLTKSVLVVGALALGGLNYLDGGRMKRWLDGFRSRLAMEVILVATVLVLTAALATTEPTDGPLGVGIKPIPEAAPGVSMQVVPGRPGVNRIVVRTTDPLADGSTLELVLDRLDIGSTLQVPLIPPGISGLDSHAEGTNEGQHGAADGTIDWVADAIVLPAGSRWDASVLVLSDADGSEISRQRFTFTLSDAGIGEGRATSILDPATAVAAALLLGGALGLGLGIGGASLPRCEAVASRIALLAGGGIAVVLGAAIGATQLLR